MNHTQRDHIQAEFEEWWQAYPRKVGRLAAEKEYFKARRLASAEKLLTGVQRYVRTKPFEIAYCYPKTWLSQGRWLDDVDAPTRKVAGTLQNWWDT